jgi:hypothetical protein
VGAAADSARAELAAAAGDLRELREQLAGALEGAERARQEAAAAGQLQAQLGDLTAQRGQLQARNAELEARVAALQGQVADLQRQLAAQRAQHDAELAAARAAADGGAPSQPAAGSAPALAAEQSSHDLSPEAAAARERQLALLRQAIIATGSALTLSHDSRQRQPQPHPPPPPPPLPGGLPPVLAAAAAAAVDVPMPPAGALVPSTQAVPGGHGPGGFFRRSLPLPPVNMQLPQVWQAQLQQQLQQHQQQHLAQQQMHHVAQSRRMAEAEAVVKLLAARVRPATAPYGARPAASASSSRRTSPGRQAAPPLWVGQTREQLQQLAAEPAPPLWALHPRQRRQQLVAERSAPVLPRVPFDTSAQTMEGLGMRGAVHAPWPPLGGGGPSSAPTSARGARQLPGRSMAASQQLHGGLAILGSGSPHPSPRSPRMPEGQAPGGSGQQRPGGSAPAGGPQAAAAGSRRPGTVPALRLQGSGLL